MRERKRKEDIRAFGKADGLVGEETEDGRFSNHRGRLATCVCACVRVRYVRNMYGQSVDVVTPEKRLARTVAV